ncbi:MAG: AAA family ATPase [Planctomycetota bacterium]|nr:AAA family ATPase [Planctomycetota bacterium]
MSALQRLPVPFVLVTGGKGGVGKSTLAANLAISMAREGRRTLLVDLDLGLGDLETMLALPEGPSLEDALDGPGLAACVRAGPCGLDVLPAANGAEALARGDEALRGRFVAALAQLASRYELVLGDSAAGIGPDVLAFACLADRVLVTTTPDVTALTDAYGLIKALDRYGERTGADVPTPELVINQASDVAEADGIARKLRSICQRFLCRSPRHAGWLPRSQRIARGAAGRPFALESEGLEVLCLRQLGLRLDRSLRHTLTTV